MYDDTDITSNPGQLQALMLARLQIEQLRRWYAFATDQLGMVDEPDAQTTGLDIYHRIFTPNADIRVTRNETTLLSARGPDGWAKVARDALRVYSATQHLIGTQLVTFESVEFVADTGALAAGSANMSSYLQATHIWPDQRERLVLGTYLDHVQWVPSGRWQIDDMTLVYTSEVFRPPGEPS